MVLEERIEKLGYRRVDNNEEDWNSYVEEWHYDEEYNYPTLVLDFAERNKNKKIYIRKTGELDHYEIVNEITIEKDKVTIEIHLYKNLKTIEFGTEICGNPLYEEYTYTIEEFNKLLHLVENI